MTNRAGGGFVLGERVRRRELWLWSSGVGLVVVRVGGSEGCAADLLGLTGAAALHHYPEVGDAIVEPASLYVV